MKKLALLFLLVVAAAFAQDDVHGPTMPPPQHCDPCAQCAYWQAVACYWGAGPSCYDNSCNDVMQSTKPVPVPAPKRTMPRKAQVTSLFTPLASLVPATYTPVK